MAAAACLYEDQGAEFYETTAAVGRGRVGLVTPMNQFDATTTPMFDCFTSIPDFSPFNAVTNLVALDELNPIATTLRNPQQRRDALTSANLPLGEADRCDEDLLNQILWRATRPGPYPNGQSDEWTMISGQYCINV